MNKIRYCAFNVDTACVEVFFADGTQVSIYTPAVDAELDITMKQQAEVDWLIYNDPVTYVNLVFTGKLEEYTKAASGIHSLDD